LTNEGAAVPEPKPLCRADPSPTVGKLDWTMIEKIEAPAGIG
jgi:hypothetical protein